MTALSIWLRRGSARWIILGGAAFFVILAVTDHPWTPDAGWGLRRLSAAVYIAAPLVAGLVAYDVGVRAGRGTASIAGTGPRGAWASLTPAALVWGGAVLATACGWVAVVVLVSRAGGVPPNDIWLVPETVAAYAAAAGVGALVAQRLDGYVAVAIAPAIVLGATTLLTQSGLSVFEVATSTGPLFGIERTPSRAIWAITANACIASAAAVLLVARSHQLRHRSALRLGTALVVGTVLGAGMLWPATDSEYRPVPSTACVGAGVADHRIEVCGPPNLRSRLPRFAQALSAARESLTSSRLPLPDRFVIARGDSALRLPEGSSTLSFGASAVIDGLTISDVVTSLATPEPCRAFYSDTDSDAALGRVDRVTTWLGDQLNAARHDAAPAGVAADYAWLRDCPREAS